ncbi:MAG: metal-dependent hydrolase [Gammaproteobacteria bacterium]|jgi:inner membrane protein
MTHGLLGALTIRSIPVRKENISLKEITILAFIAAIFPDIDYLTFWIHPLQFLAEWHRAATHSFIMMPAWSITIGFIAASVVKARWKWRVYSLVCAIAISTHILSDMITIYGTQIFNPISDYKAVIGTTFFIDGYFTGIVLTGIIISIILKRFKAQYHRLFATITICVLISYLGLQTYFRSIANEFAHQYAEENQLHGVVVHNLPQPFSPTHWKVIVESTENYQVSFVNVMPADWHQAFTQFMVKVLSADSQTLLDAAQYYLPLEEATWERFKKIESQDNTVAGIWNLDEFSSFRKFAVFPVLYRKDHDDAGTCFWFTDLRYVFPVMLPPFRYGMCSSQNQWSPYRLQRNTKNSRRPLQWPFL